MNGLFNIKSFSSPLVIITGHYGCGKTTLALNLAYEMAREAPLTLVDLDIANPFFRSSDDEENLKAADIKLAGPVYAGSNLDAPALSPLIATAIGECSSERPVLIDVGGDDEGATTLSRFTPKILQLPQPYELLYVANFNRLQTASPQEAYEYLLDIQRASRLEATALVGNTHLQDETEASMILDSLEPLKELAQLCGLPIAFVCAPADIAEEMRRLMDQQGYDDIPLQVITSRLRRPWD